MRYQKCLSGLHVKYPLLPDFDENNLINSFSKYTQISNWEPSSMRAYARPDMTKLMVPVHNIENAPKSCGIRLPLVCMTFTFQKINFAANSISW
jgi:hypothetical protein